MILSTKNEWIQNIILNKVKDISKRNIVFSSKIYKIPWKFREFL